MIPAAPRRARVIPIEAASYTPHPLHGGDAIWEQTNCAFDAWVELLHALGLDPTPAAAFTVAADFWVDQWALFEFPARDLRDLYGIEFNEMNAWGGVLDHVCSHLGRGELVTLEVDSWFLPDTVGLSYRSAHVKSAIVPNEIDADARHVAYFHNSGYYELGGDDFDGVFRLGAYAAPEILGPYMEIIRLGRMRRPEPAELTVQTLDLLAAHLRDRPQTHPITRLAERVEADLGWLCEQAPEVFHDYAFSTVRQCGASASTIAALCRWLAERELPTEVDRAGDLATAAEHFTSVSQTAKSQQLKLARIARGRSSSMSAGWKSMVSDWTSGQRLLDPFAAR